jgi:hypothetical protein
MLRPGRGASPRSPAEGATLCLTWGPGAQALAPDGTGLQAALFDGAIDLDEELALHNVEGFDLDEELALHEQIKAGRADLPDLDLDPATEAVLRRELYVNTRRDNG